MKNCKSCGTELEMVVKPFVCDMTGMVYDTEIKNCGKCTNDYSHLPSHIQRKLEDLDYLESAGMALGLHDKILAARHLIDKEIESWSKISTKC